MHLDYSRYAEAQAAIARGNETVEVNCSCCQGMSLPGCKPGENGYCPDCNGTATVAKYRHEWSSINDQLSYWQARALVAEADLRKGNANGGA